MMINKLGQFLRRQSLSFKAPSLPCGLSPSAFSLFVVVVALIVADPLSARAESSPLIRPLTSLTTTLVAEPGSETVVASPLRIDESILDVTLAALVEIHRPAELAERSSADPIVLAQAETNDPAVMDDDELSDVRAGEFKMNMNNFDVLIQDNQAGQFKFDIAQNAFHGAQGVFTTLQTVNSAVDLTVIVNIYLGRQT